jgi:hypothetical protein
MDRLKFGLLVEGITKGSRPATSVWIAVLSRRIDANCPRDVGLRVAALQERINLARSKSTTI